MDARDLPIWATVWLVAGLLIGLEAGRKGHNFLTWFFYGFIVWPIALIHMIFLKPTRVAGDRRAQEDGQKQCPACAEWVRPEAKICKHCRSKIS